MSCHLNLKVNFFIRKINPLKISKTLHLSVLISNNVEEESGKYEENRRSMNSAQELVQWKLKFKFGAHSKAIW